MNDIKELKLFDFLKSLTSEKKDLTNHPRFNIDYNPFMINRFLCMSDDPISLTLGMYLSTKNFPKFWHFKFLLHELPKRYIRMDYVKKSVNNDDKNIVEKIQQCYNVGKGESEEIFRIFSDTQKENLIKSFGGGITNESGKSKGKTVRYSKSSEAKPASKRSKSRTNSKSKLDQ